MRQDAATSSTATLSFGGVGPTGCCSHASASQRQPASQPTTRATQRALLAPRVAPARHVRAEAGRSTARRRPGWLGPGGSPMARAAAMHASHATGFERSWACMLDDRCRSRMRRPCATLCGGHCSMAQHGDTQQRNIPVGGQGGSQVQLFHWQGVSGLCVQCVALHHGGHGGQGRDWGRRPSKTITAPPPLPTHQHPDAS